MIQTIALVKGPERYVVLYDADSTGQALRQLGRWACDARLSFTWFDAAALSECIRNRRW